MTSVTIPPRTRSNHRTPAAPPEHTDLWHAIESFDIDGAPTEFSFVARLARENAWSIDVAHRVVAEYRRFIFLAMTAGHPVTPSDQVDQAWHLHLTYTRSYWERLCRDTLPRPLHHEPTRGGQAEDRKFDDWYARTKQSYERLFSSPPPADLWPDADTRFHDDLHYARVHIRRNWIIPKARARRFGAALVAILLPALLLAGCSPFLLADSLPLGLLGMGVLFVGLVVVVALLKSAAAPRDTRRRRAHSSACDSDAGLLGWFVGGDHGSNSSHHPSPSSSDPSHPGHHSHHGHHHSSSDSHHGHSGCASHSDTGSGCASSGCASSGCSGGSGCGGGGCSGGGD
jgi:uncharacterized membrane protein YgcG